MVGITGVRLEEAGVQGRDSYPFLVLESTEGRSLALRHTDIALGACHLCPPLLLVNLGRHRRDVTTDLHPHAYISVSPR